MTAFAVLFSIFVVVTLVLIVLTVRFTLQRAAVARARWLEASEDPDQEESVDEKDGDDRGMTALVLGGGGPRGAVQIGMLQVLAEHGFVPDRIYGCSVGAVNGVGFACDPTVEGVERMTRIWTGINREHVFPQGRLHGPGSTSSSAKPSTRIRDSGRSSRTGSPSNVSRTFRCRSRWWPRR